MNIYVGNLPYNANEDEVREAFSEFGQVTSVALIKDKVTGLIWADDPMDFLLPTASLPPMPPWGWGLDR